MRPILTFILILFISNAFSQTSTDTALVADYNDTSVSFINLSMTLNYPAKFAEVLKVSGESKKPVKIVYSTKTYTLVSAELITLKKVKNLSEEIAFLSGESSMVTGVQTGAVDTISALLKDHIKTAELNNLFTFLSGLACAKSTTCKNGKMPCITFQYKANGCQARAHLMRYYIEDSFFIQSKKIFLFGSLRAKNNDECGASCINWGWHVAPVVNELDSTNTIIQKVIDPSLFTKPVTIEEWKNAQLNCSTYASMDTTYIVDSKFYNWDYTGHGRSKTRYFYEDDQYTYTLDFLRPKCRKCN